MESDAPQRPERPSPAPAGGAARAIGPEALDRLWETVLSRRSAPASSSYTASLLARFPHKPAQKLAEEASECVIEAVTGDRAALVRESADLLYHLVVLLVGAGVEARTVFGELEARERRALKREAAKRRVRRKAVRGAMGATSKIP